MKLGRLRAAAAALFVLASLPAPARAGEPIFLAADRDDDDADGVPDGDQAKVAASPELPALTLGMDELVAGIAAHFGPDVGKLVSYEPQPTIEAQFGSYPRLLTPIADGLGFMDDGDAAMLVARALDLDSSRQRTAR